MITNKSYTTSFISLPKKVVLLTYDKESDGQYYYNCNFNIPTDIPPGPQGNYMVTFNEALFQNTHPILYKGDWLNFKFNNTIENYEITEDVFIKNNNEFVTYMNTVVLTSSPNNIQFKNLVGTDDADRGVNALQLIANNDFTVSYSINFGYIFNNINKELTSTNKEIVFTNTRFIGPFTYIIRTNLIPQVPTLNELGQTYNMTLLTYNVTSKLGDYVQMASTMQCITSNITSLKIELINDQGDPVKITTPMYIQVTIEPYLPYKENETYYKK